MFDVFDAIRAREESERLRRLEEENERLEGERDRLSNWLVALDGASPLEISDMVADALMGKPAP